MAVLKQGQGQHHPMDQQHMPMGAQPGGAAFAVAQLPPCSPGGLGVQIQQAAPVPSQFARATAAIKGNARLAADVWQSLAGTRYYIAWGSFSVAEELTPEILDFILKTVAGVTPVMIKQLPIGPRFRRVFPATPAGETNLAMPADVHFRTFSATFAAVLEHGMGSAPIFPRLSSVFENRS